MVSPYSPQPEYISDQIGNAEDTVDIQLGSDDPVICRTWSIHEGVLAQPGQWSVDTGVGTNARELFARYPPGTPFTLRVCGQPQATGALERRRLQGRRGTAGTSLVLSGRDALMPLHKAHVTAQLSFENASYVDMVTHAMQVVGIDPSRLRTSNTANRNMKAGIPLTELAPPVDVNAAASQSIAGTIGATAAQLQAKFGERWLDFLRRHLDRAGLFLWAGGDGTIILSAPNGSQVPRYQLYRDLDATAANILDWFVDDDTTNRHTEVVTYARGGGRKAGRQKWKGGFVDQEMLDYAAAAAGQAAPGEPDQGYDQLLAVRDKDCQTGGQAEYFARRKIAEERRSGWHAEYVVPGHTLPVFAGNASGVSGARAVLTVDTLVHIEDELAGLSGDFYIESLVRERPGPSAGLQTTIRLMRPEDLVFGELDSPKAQGKTEPQKKAAKEGTRSTTPYYALGVIPPNAVGQNSKGQYLDASGNVITGPEGAPQ